MSRGGPLAQPKPWIPSLPIEVEDELKTAFTRRQILIWWADICSRYGLPFDPEVEKEYPRLVQFLKQLAGAKK